MTHTEFQWASVPSTSCDIAHTLSSGQTFSWSETPSGAWHGAIGDTAVILRPADDGFWWQTYPRTGQWQLIERYFALDVNLDELYVAWVSADRRIASAIERFRGLRVLRQDTAEALFTFQCATCNTMVKIRRSVQALARIYGREIRRTGDETTYAFPTPEQLALASEAELRRELWGFRAPRVIELARRLSAEDGLLYSLRNSTYEEAHARLTELPGIGAKVADCVCLFGLGFDQAVPVDTHIWQIAVELWHPHLSGKSLTRGVYNTIAGTYRDTFGPYAGWAQQYLFLEKTAKSA